MRGPGGGKGGDFARPYEKRGPPGHDQRHFAKPNNKPYSPQVPPATLALLVSLQGAPWRAASDFRRQLVRAGHAPVPPVDAIDKALQTHAAAYGIASRIDADGRRRFTVVDKTRAAKVAARRRREARDAPCTSHSAAVAEASTDRVEAAARSDALFERLARRLAAAGVPLSSPNSPCAPPCPEPPVFRVAVPLARGDDASSAWETVEPTPKPRRPGFRTVREDASADSWEASPKHRPRTVREDTDSWEASPQHPVTDRRRRRRGASAAVSAGRWASPASAHSDLTDSPSAEWSAAHLRD